MTVHLDIISFLFGIAATLVILGLGDLLFNRDE